MTAPSQSPGRTPAAEVAIDVALARELVASQHPDLGSLPIVPLATGWDNAVFRLGADYVLRLPRRSLAAPLILHEQRWLPLLAGRLPLRIPVPLRIGRPQGRYPWAWSILPWIEGEPSDQAPLLSGEATRLAEFFAALHVEAPADAPRNPYRGVPLAERAAMFEARAALLADAGRPLDAALRTIWADALAAPLDVAPTWLHGDPHPRNVLVAGGRITGIIDWGDVAAGDRAADLAGIWLLLSQPEARSQAFGALPSVSAATWRRARGWALLYGVILSAAGLAGDARMAAIGAATFARLDARR
jgi:aminoglycoside phosphotransferase (APT) family kinase protein